MNLVNRLVVMILLVAITAAAIGLAAFPEQFVLLMRAIFVPMEINFLDRIVLAVIAVVVTVVCAVLFRAELKREQPRGVVLASVEGASAQLATDSIAERLKNALEGLPEIHNATAKVKSRGRSIDVWVTLLADPGVDVTQKAAEAAGVIHETVEKGMGVKIAKGGPKVDIKYHHSSMPRIDLRR